MKTPLLRGLAVAAFFATFAFSPALSQDESATETVRIWPPGGDGPVAHKTAICPGNVALNDTAVTFEGTFSTTSSNQTQYEVVFTYGTADGSGELDHIEPTTNLGSWNVTSEGTTTTASLVVGVSNVQALAWTFGLIGTGPGLVFYTWQIRVRGDLRTDESCTFEIIVLPGRIAGQVLFAGDFGAEGLDGVRVTLCSPSGDSLDTTITIPFDANQDGDFDDRVDRGWYFFNALVPGIYRVKVDFSEPWEPDDPESGEQDVGVPPGGEGRGDFGGTPGTPDDGGGGTRAPFDFGDLITPYPDTLAVCPTATGTRPCYQTLDKDDGAKHAIRDGLSIGPTVDTETDGQPDPDALLDDVFGDDEDGLLFRYWPQQGGQATLAVGVRNETEEVAYLNGWIDINDNGQLGDTPNEHVIQGVAVTPVPGAIVPFGFSFPVPPLTANRQIALRLRLTTVSVSARPYGAYKDGEVEDYIWDFSQEIRGEFGDAPEEPDDAWPDVPWGYPTRIQNDGARHGVLKNVRLGDLIDPDPGGQPTILADGDDADGGVENQDEPVANDDDGIVFGDGFVPIGVFTAVQRGGGRLLRYGVAPGDSATITPLASTEGVFDAWFDWNRNGSWEDAGEHVFNTVEVEDAPEYTPLRLKVPDDADPGYTFARFRFNQDDDLETTGFSLDGEVEDYIFRILSPIQVTTLEDDGPGSLRQAIIDANGMDGIQVIRVDEFAATAGKTAAPILVQSPLPEITDAVIIDGGSVAVIDGSQAGDNANGLVISARGTVITGLGVQTFSANGILVGPEFNSSDEGGPVLIHANTISGNGGAGVRIIPEASTPGPSISANRIYQNGGLAIDHSSEGVTANAENEGAIPDFPTITSVTQGSAIIEGTLSGLPSSIYVIDFFASTQCDPSGHGEAEFYVGSTEVTTGEAGGADFSVAFDTTIQNFHQVTATATSSEGTTSEMSQCTTAVGTEADAPEQPEGFRLIQNYPNPFSGTTTLEFEVPVPSEVRIDVFNALGQIVRTPVDRELAPGRYEAAIDAGDLPSGVYFYQLRAGAYVAAKAMVVLK